jgi:predicted RNase H-like HicB family nuclease
VPSLSEKRRKSKAPGPGIRGDHSLGLSYDSTSAMTCQDYKTVLFRREDGSWVAEIPAIPGCYALMESRDAALAELDKVFALIAQEYRQKGQPLPADSTEIINA